MICTGCFICLVLLLFSRTISLADEPAPSPVWRVPAFTAYSEPNPDAVQVSKDHGITGWTDPKTRISWFLHLTGPGKVHVRLNLRRPETGIVKLKMTSAKQAHFAQVKGGSQETVQADFGDVDIPSPGFYRFELEGISKEGRSFGDLDSLTLDGTAMDDAEYNSEERRNAASVHLGYPVAADAKITAFYNEVTVRTDPIWSYYMACGFQRGYFGIQVNSPSERRIIFSVWDSGGEAIDRNKVDAEDRVQLLAKGEDVTASDFGNEGTGGHSHLVYPWRKDTTYRFLVTAKPEGAHTTYSGYFYFPEKRAWALIASFRAPKDGNTLRGLYSFNENFGGANGQLRRLAEFGNQWVRTTDGKWIELTSARFTHDPTGRKNRKDYGAGAKQGRFYLSNGGFIAEPIHYGDIVRRSAGNKPPADIPTTILP